MPRGVEHGNSELNDAEVIQIYKSTLSTRKIAAHFNISHSAVAAIKHKKTWKWLTDSLDTNKREIPRADSRRMMEYGDITPDGLAFLAKICVPDARMKVNTLALSRFATYLQSIIDKADFKRPGRVRNILHAAKFKSLKEDQKAPLSVNLTLPAQYALAVYQMWDISGVAPSAILVALVAYGLEHLAQELRQYPSFPEVPKNPGKKLSAPSPLPKTEAPSEKPSPKSDFF